MMTIFGGVFARGLANSDVSTLDFTFGLCIIIGIIVLVMSIRPERE